MKEYNEELQDHHFSWRMIYLAVIVITLFVYAGLWLFSEMFR